MRNVIFDMGNVLITFDPEDFVARLAPDPGDQRLLLEAIYYSPEWPMMDKGEVTEPQLEALARTRLPERLHSASHVLISQWDQLARPIPGMADLIRECKGAGLGVYLLSNASLRQPEYWPAIPGAEFFDGAMISAFERLVKPDPEIYRRLLSRYRLEAKDCLFVDDVPANVEGALAAGIPSFLFTGDAEAVRARIFKV